MEFINTHFKRGINLGGWLSQCSHQPKHYDYFITEEDIKRIASWGLDHVRLPIDYEVLEMKEGLYSQKGFSYIENCIGWCKKAGLRVVLDLHKAPGYSFAMNLGDKNQAAANVLAFFKDSSKIQRLIDLWKEIARRFCGESEWVAFEFLNEMVDPTGGLSWNGLVQNWITVIRQLAPDSLLIIGSNYFNSLHTLDVLGVPADEKIVYSFHFYEPMTFTHQKAFWMDFISKEKEMSYPGDLKDYEEEIRTANSPDLMASRPMLSSVPKAMDIHYLESLILKASQSAERLGVSLYCGEYGVIDQASPESTLNWYADINSLFEKYSISRALWTYKEKDFGLLSPGLDGVRSRLLEHL